VANIADLPVVTSVLGTADHPGGLALRCGLQDGRTLDLAIDFAAVSAFLVAITERSTRQGRLKPGQSLLSNPLKFQAVTALSGPSASACEGALAFHMHGGWMLTLGFTPASLAATSAKIAVLSAMMRGPHRAQH
jgi:hypothetical protein